MNKSQGNYFKMFLNTQDCLDNYSTEWSAIPIVLNMKNDYDELISRIIGKSEEAQTFMGVSEHKKKEKKTIATKVSSLSGVIQAYAHGINNDDLVKSVKVSRTAIEETKDQDVDALVSSILKIAQNILTELADYGVTENMINEIGTSLEEFNALIGKPRSIRNSKFVTLETIELLFEECNKLLKNKIDKVMLMFRDTKPEFYSSYERARTIVDM